jgi:hypothetical protein
MHRLAEFEHHIIGNVHHRVNAAYSAAAQPLLHPQRCRNLRIDTFDHAPGVTRTGNFRAERDAEFASCLGRYRLDG